MTHRIKTACMPNRRITVAAPTVAQIHVHSGQTSRMTTRRAS